MLKGMGIGAIIKLVLAVMIASLFISISTVGSLGQALSQSFEDIDTIAGAQEIEIEDELTLGDLMMLTTHRAMNKGCKAIEENNKEDGYPGLQGTYLTSNPPCFGGDAGILRGTGGVVNPGGLGADDNFMAGIYSREKFIVKENMTIGGGYVRSTYEFENISGVFQGTPQSNSANVEVNNQGGDASIVATAAGGAAAGAVVGPLGAAGGAVVGAIAGAAGGAINNFLNEQPDIMRPLLFFEDADVYERTSLERGESDADLDSFNIRLCEGDEGYVQSNRGGIDEFEQSSESPLIPMIVIQNSKYETCGDSGALQSPGDYGAESIPEFIPDDWDSISTARKHEFTNSYDNTFWWAITGHPDDDESGNPNLEFTVLSGDVDLGDGEWKITGKINGPEDSNYNQMSEGWQDCEGSSDECTFQGTIENVDNCGTHKIEIRMDYSPNAYEQWWNAETEYQDEDDSTLQDSFTTDIENSCDNGDEDSSTHDPDNYGAESVPDYIPDEWATIPWQRKHEYTNSYDNTFWWALTEYPGDGTIEVSDPGDASPSFELKVVSKDQDLGDGDWTIGAGIKGPDDSDYELMSEGWQDCEGSSDECTFQGTIGDIEQFGTYEIEVTMDYQPNGYYHYWNPEIEFQDEEDAEMQETFKIEIENSE